MLILPDIRPEKKKIFPPMDNAGKKFQFRILDIFLRLWNGMFSQSPAVRLAWKTKLVKPCVLVQQQGGGASGKL